jgi:hypothetical protein
MDAYIHTHTGRCMYTHVSDSSVFIVSAYDRLYLQAVPGLRKTRLTQIRPYANCSIRHTKTFSRCDGMLQRDI